ncbi:MAG TPA: malate dehydrogenase [Methanomicrobiales archaeon]|nr:malate dehydrogenase [Methanomicrobiales archaeon]
MTTVSILGASGRIGSFAAHAISHDPHVGEILLIGRDGSEDRLDGLARDLQDSFAARGSDIRIGWSVDLEDLRGSDIVVFTAGIPRHSGQDRLDLAMENARIVAPAARAVGRVAPDAIIFMVTNPVDVMTTVALKVSGMQPERVFGLGTHLDSMRLKSLIADFFRVHVSEVHTRIIGEHGESMVPLWSATTIGGIQVENLPAFSSLPREEMISTVKTSGDEIIRKMGATTYGPGEAIATLVHTILGNENRILTVSRYIVEDLDGTGDVCIGAPARINRNGVFPVPIRIEESEAEAFRCSVEKIRGITSQVLDRLGME